MKQWHYGEGRAGAGQNAHSRTALEKKWTHLFESSTVPRPSPLNAHVTSNPPRGSGGALAPFFGEDTAPWRALSVTPSAPHLNGVAGGRFLTHVARHHSTARAGAGAAVERANGPSREELRRKEKVRRAHPKE